MKIEIFTKKWKVIVGKGKENYLASLATGYLVDLEGGRRGLAGKLSEVAGKIRKVAGKLRKFLIDTYVQAIILEIDSDFIGLLKDEISR